MKQSLYRKYRPQNFDDVIGQDTIVKTLQGALKQERISHAYLFTGPRGTGKTTLARIFAKTLNCEKQKDSNACGKCNNCIAITEGSSINIIEIDAASHTGVENIRQLREEAKLSPTNAPYKVYIIDEVHMLSTGAFNALLKILEEPPAHVLFILATTEIHKVPETILSRVQRYDLTRISLGDIVKKLERISKQEKVAIDKESLELIAFAAEGGMRNAESLLSQVFALGEKKITLSDTQLILGSSHKETVGKLIQHTIDQDPLGAFEVINSATQDGVIMEHLLKDIIAHLRQLLLLLIDPKKAKTLEQELTKEQISLLGDQAKQTSLAWIVFAIDTFLASRESLRSSFIPQLPLETAIVKITHKDELRSKPPQAAPPKNPPLAPSPTTPTQPTRIASSPTPSQTPSPGQSAPTMTPHTTPEEKKEPQQEALSIEEVPEPIKKIPIPSGGNPITYDIVAIQNAWPTLLENIREHNHSLNAFLANCSPTKIEENCVIIVTKFEFYKEKLEETKNKLTIQEVLCNIVKEPVSLVFVTEQESGEHVDTSWKRSGTNDSIISDAVEVFGKKAISSET